MAFAPWATPYFSAACRSASRFCRDPCGHTFTSCSTDTAVLIPSAGVFEKRSGSHTPVPPDPPSPPEEPANETREKVVQSSPKAGERSERFFGSITMTGRPSSADWNAEYGDSWQIEVR